MEKMFEVALRNQFRFPFTKGHLSVEDLFTLRLKDLDGVYQNLYAHLRVIQNQEVSLLNEKSKGNQELDLKIEIVKYIVQLKKDEQNAAKKQMEKNAHNQKIMQLIEKKKDEELENLSADELQKLLID